ncbi:MAG: sugar phosphate isomerase/epimerase family protein [Terriglobia bacterium]
MGERRAFLKKSFLALAGLGTLGRTEIKTSAQPAASGSVPAFKLGMVTYELGKNWDIETIIKNCETTGFEAVELRTTHKHGVELSLPKDKRAEVRKRFEGSRVRLLSLGSTCEYHYADQAIVAKNIEETRRWCELAHDLGCLGVKVRPNGFVKGVPHEATLEQIGKALQKCGDAARDQGVEIWVEVHGSETEFPPNIRRIMDVCNHPAVGICWNSNDTDIVNGSVKEYFDLLKPWLRNSHINELWRSPAPWGATASAVPEKALPGFPSYAQPYPYRELFGLMRAAGYNRYTLAEVPESSEPIRFMRYYRALWEELAA